MKFIAGTAFGFLLAATIALAGSYSITLTTSPTADSIIPAWVVAYNARNGTSYTALQFAQKICNDAVEQRALMITGQMGR